METVTFQGRQYRLGDEAAHYPVPLPSWIPKLPRAEAAGVSGSPEATMNAATDHEAGLETAPMF